MKDIKAIEVDLNFYHHSSTLQQPSTPTPRTIPQPFTASKMQIKAILLTPLVAVGLVSAAPSKPYNFEIMSLRSASPIHFAGVQAAQSNIFLKLPHQNASCDHKSDNLATFSLVDGELHLYRKSATPQILYVDRSGMGRLPPLSFHLLN